jgi:hypothetical protein
MKLQKFLLVLVGVGLAVAGSLVWKSRLEYSPETLLQRKLGSGLLEVDSEKPNDLSEECNIASEQGGWILFVMNAQLLADNKARTYFETAVEPSGLFVEYDPGMLRLGLGLGPGSAESNLELPIRLVRNDETATIIIGVSRDETRVITNGVDRRIGWPGDSYREWRCDPVQIADDIRESSHGYRCEGCNTRLRYATGQDPASLGSLLDGLSNVERFNTRRFIGTGLTLVGLALVLTRFRRSGHLNHE